MKEVWEGIIDTRISINIFQHVWNAAWKELQVLPLSLKAAISKVVLSQTFKTLTKFIEKNAKIYSTKLISLDLS